MANLLTIPEVCKYLRISRRTLERHFADGVIGRYRIGRRVLVDQREIEQFVKRNKVL